MKTFGAEPKPGWAIFGAKADVLLIGSKAGALSHEGAANVKARAIIPIGPVPYTTKAVVALQRAGVAVVPDFLALAGPHLAAFGDVGEGAEAAANGVSEAVSVAVHEALQHPDGLFLGACLRAEAFLSSWQPSLPFGRPLA